ncbi:MAG: hypothetical protein H7Z40_22760 [Phycisphaerae bacterium]|nr:hypothetical protein [Gemmatimonadaceae bacterium]
MPSRAAEEIAELANDRVSDGSRKRDLLVIAACGFLLYALNVDFWIYGDSGMYADYALRRKFTEVTLHIGYYALVIAGQATVGQLLGLPIQETMGWMNVAFGAATLCVVYLLALELLKSRPVALLTVVMFGLSGRVIANSTSSEVYITQTFFVLLSFLQFARGRTLVTAAAATMSLLISPLSAFAFLFFPVYDYQQHGVIRWKQLGTLAVVSLALYLPYLVVHGHDLLWGRRGLLAINTNVAPNPVAGLMNFPKYQFKQFTALLLLSIPAMWVLRRNVRFFWLAVAVAVPHIYVIIKLTGEDNVFILNTDFFFAAALALGWTQLSHTRWRWLGPLALAGHLSLYVVSRSLFAFEHHRDYSEEMRDIAQRYLRNEGSAMITDWGTAIALTFYGRERAVGPVMDDPLFRRIYNTEENPPHDPSLLTLPNLYLLDRWKPTPLSRLLSSSESLRRQTNEHSIKLQAERRLNLTCRLLQERTNRLYQCTPNAPVPQS